MHPIGIAILLPALYFVVCGSRRAALTAMVVGILYLTEGQSINIGINLFAIRILGVALFARVLFRREFSFSNLNRIDRAVLIVYPYIAVVYLLRSGGQEDLSPIAAALDSCFCYFGFRGLIRSEEDLKWLLRMLVVLLIPYAFCVALERVTGRSPFIFMGGPGAGWSRGGVPRCMASFRYPVSLGTFGGTFLALYIGLWFSKKDRLFAWLGIALCLGMVIASNSGGSVTAGAVALLAWLLWRFRREMRLFRWGIVFMILALAVVMKAPVWYVLNRVSFGGDSWHRAYLIDVALRNLSKWWLIGMKLADTAHWFPYTNLGVADITNQYLVFGLQAGIGAMALFVVLLVRTFGNIGAAMAKVRATPAPAASAFLLWGLGVMLGVHVITWFGISYFDQIYAVWYLQLACAASITDRILRSSEVVKATVVTNTAGAQKRREPQVAWG